MQDDSYYFNGIRENNFSILKEFIEECRPRVYSLVTKMDSQRKIDSDDIFQDAMAVVFFKIRSNSLHESDMTARLSTYLCAVAQNKCRDVVKSSRYGKEGSLMDVSHNSYSMWEDPAESEEIDKSLYVLELARKVKPPCNEMLEDYYLKGLPYEKIAEKHGYKNYNSAKKKNGECLKKARILAMEDPYFRSKLLNRA